MNDGDRYVSILAEAKHYRHAHNGEKDTAYLRLKKQIVNLDLPAVSYEQRVKRLCDAMQY